MSAHDIFLSYSSVDKERIVPIVNRLQAEGWTVWWDRYIPHGQSFDDVIEVNLDASKCVVVLWSEKSVKSRWVRTEAGEADDRNALFPAKIDDVKIPLAFRRLQTADLTNFEENEFEKFIKSIHNFLGTEAQISPKKSPKVYNPKLNESNIFEDPRDGNEYQTIKLKDGKIWMAENLRYKTGSGCWAFENDEKYVNKYGYLYTWKAALKACPPGWHLPSDAEWLEMVNGYGGCFNGEDNDGKDAYDVLRKGGITGFNALFSGRRGSGTKFYFLDSVGYFWSSTEMEDTYAWSYEFSSHVQFLNRIFNHKSWAFSVRCVQD